MPGLADTALEKLHAAIVAEKQHKRETLRNVVEGARTGDVKRFGAGLSQLDSTVHGWLPAFVITHPPFDG